MPLTYSGDVGAEEAADDTRRRARKIKPQLARGPLRRVTTARHQAEAEFVQMLLLEEGIPSILRRTAGFDVPDFLAAGPRDVLVPESGADVARQVLRETEISAADEAAGPPALRLFLGILAAIAGFALFAWLLFVIFG